MNIMDLKFIKIYHFVFRNLIELEESSYQLREQFVLELLRSRLTYVQDPYAFEQVTQFAEHANFSVQTLTHFVNQLEKAYEEEDGEQVARFLPVSIQMMNYALSEELYFANFLEYQTLQEMSPFLDVQPKLLLNQERAKVLKKELKIEQGELKKCRILSKQEK